MNIYHQKIPSMPEGGIVYNFRIDTLLESIFVYLKSTSLGKTDYYRLHLKKFKNCTYNFDGPLPKTCTFFFETDLEQVENFETDLEQEDDLYSFSMVVGTSDAIFRVVCEDLELKKIATCYKPTEKE